MGSDSVGYASAGIAYRQRYAKQGRGNPMSVPATTDYDSLSHAAPRSFRIPAHSPNVTK